MSGNLLGFSYRDAKDETGKYVVQDVSKSNLFLKEFFRAQDKKQAYENALAESFSGLDKTEILFHKEVSNQEGGRKNVFYFQNEWKEYDENLNSFFASETDGFFLLKDFVYGQTKIESGSVITKIETKDAIHEIDSKNALVAAVYEAKKGQNVKIEFLSSQSQQEENVAFSV